MNINTFLMHFKGFCEPLPFQKKSWIRPWGHPLISPRKPFFLFDSKCASAYNKKSKVHLYIIKSPNPSKRKQHYLQLISQELRENKLASQRENTNKNRAGESQEQHENRLAAKREIREESVPRKLLKELMPKGLRLIEKVKKESVTRNHKNNVKTGSRLKEKLLKESVSRKLLKELIQGKILV